MAWLWVLAFALVLAGILVAAWIDGFARIGRGALALVFALMVLSMAVDYAATALGAKRFGGSRFAVLGALAGLLLGFVLGPIGFLVGPPLGAVALELVLAKKPQAEALRAGLGTFLGFLLGTVAKLALVGLMIGVALFSYLV